MEKLLRRFEFSGNRLFTSPASGDNLSGTDKLPPQVHFEYHDNRIKSFQIGDDDLPLLDGGPSCDANDTALTVPYPYAGPPFRFRSDDAHKVLQKLNTDNLDDLFKYYQGLSKEEIKQAFGHYVDEEDNQPSYNELKLPYSLYNWEVCFHAPMQVVEHLLKSQQFDQALAMCHYIFNPLAKPQNGEDITKACWQFPPFKEIEPKHVLRNLFNDLQPGAPSDKINEWRTKPFRPHVVARRRPSAYMKYVVAKYIEILIAYGDYYFRQNTMESIPMATQCYVMASHLYGLRGQAIPRRGKTETQTYNSLLNKWDAFGNAMVDLELAFPFTNEAYVEDTHADVGLPNIFGSLSTLYFGIPNNPNLTALRDTIDDRLLKIRNCENIDGIFQQLPLFQPPIDPGLLVQAAAQGLSLASVLNDMNSPMPNYRFYYLLQKALELCSELKALGNAFLSAKEKGDAEALSNMRAAHETGIHNLIMEIKKQQLDEANQALDALVQNRKAPYSRMQYYLKLIGEDLTKIPQEEADFSELQNQIEQPKDEGGLKLISSEKEEMDKAEQARWMQVGIGVTETLAGILHNFPTTSTDAKPWGVGTGIIWGGVNLGDAAQCIARAAQVVANDLSHQSTNAGRKTGFLRQLQDRVQQANAAGYEIKNIDKQILSQKIRIAIANQEITNQQKQIDNAQEVEEFLRNKYTNQELYSWMEGNIRTLYYQVYTLAYDLAKKAEKAYRFERGLTESNFIQFGYWEAGRDGLLSGERMYLALKQLESAYQEKRGYDYEITKSISLRQLNPLALATLRETGKCDIELPEMLFDMDYPGHYMRRIKSVALTVPCVVGPYTSLNCTLRLSSHKFRTNPVVGGEYAEDDNYSTFNVPITSIAVSTGQNDSGVFELNFKDERYIPFEGAGAISKWHIELPNDFRQFDYGTIADVVMHLRYTAVEGGANLKNKALTSTKSILESIDDLGKQEGLFGLFDLRAEFPSEWQKATHSADRTMQLGKLTDRLPYFTNRTTKNTITPMNVYLVVPSKDGQLPPVNGASLAFSAGSSDPDSVPLAANQWTDIDFSSMNNWQLTLPEGTADTTKLMLIVRYELKVK